MQWRPQETGAISILEHLLRKSTGFKLSQTKRYVMRVTINKAIQVRLPKPFGAHVSSPYSLDDGHSAKAFNVYHVSFGLLLVWILSCPHPSLLKWEYLPCPIVYWKYLTFLLIFIRVHEWKYTLSFRRNFTCGLLRNTEKVKIFVTLENRLNIVYMKYTWNLWGPWAECYGLDLKCSLRNLTIGLLEGK